MICDRVLDGPGLDLVEWVERVEVWFTEDADGVDFTEFLVFDGAHRRKTIRVAGY